MYFLIVVALIAGQPQTLAGAFKTREACAAKRAEITAIVAADESITAYSVECVAATVPGKQL